MTMVMVLAVQGGGRSGPPLWPPTLRVQETRKKSERENHCRLERGGHLAGLLLTSLRALRQEMQDQIGALRGEIAEIPSGDRGVPGRDREPA